MNWFIHRKSAIEPSPISSIKISEIKSRNQTIMLQPIIKQLNSKRIILASSSPRRREMLANIVSIIFCIEKVQIYRYPNIVQWIWRFHHVVFLSFHVGSECRITSVAVRRGSWNRSISIVRWFRWGNCIAKSARSFCTFGRTRERLWRSTASRYYNRCRYNGHFGQRNVRQAKNQRNCCGNVAQVSESGEQSFRLFQRVWAFVLIGHFKYSVPYWNRLMGRTNVVYTGLAIKYGDQIHKFTESTEVTFGKFDDAHIRAYVETGEPMYVWFM